MLAINNLSFYFGSRPLYDNANLHIKPKNRIGLIGPNGAGKSTLLRLIVGEYTPDSGEISKSNDCSIGFLNQDLLSYESDESILKVAMQAFERQNYLQTEIESLLQKLETDYSDEIMERLGNLQEEFAMLDGYTIQSKAEEILEGLGFTTEQLQWPLRQFSGGWRMRVMLAKLLLAKPSLLLMDEPTNHLDLPSIEWVENYLTNYEGAVIVVSHDRAFLDNCINTIVEVNNAKLNFYPGNYSFYVEEKALRNEIQKGAYENQQAQIRQTERFIARFKAKASKATQVQSRVKQLDKLELVEDVREENAKVNFKFTFKNPSGRSVLELEQVSKAYGDNVVLKDATLQLMRGDKVALIGANGKGKSTLLRILAGTESIGGKRTNGHNVSMSFFAQHQLESLSLEDTVLEELVHHAPDKSELELRGVLGCFLFSNDDVFKKIKVLSGGEKSRVALAKTLVSQANFLLLDEPTNHLDMVSVNILIQALQQYEGTFVSVSHDRHFVSNVANKIWYIEDQVLKEFPGTYDEYAIWQKEREKNAVQTPFKKESPKPQQNTQEAKKITPNVSKNEMNKLENQIQELETKKLELEEELSKPNVYSNIDLFAKTNSNFEKVEKELEALYQKWETVAG
ncbi:MAG TPA: ABC transporter ATP-binding protein [Cytophagales bacterium]|nr:ABC transporter ATP-binding protein [Cytophagales bacterium]